MSNQHPEDVTLSTLHEDLRDGFADLKTTLITGFRSLATREDSQEMIRLLRENNRIQEDRLTLLDARMREQFLETHQILRSLAHSQRAMSEDIRGLSADIKALIARLDALIKGRGDGGATA